MWSNAGNVVNLLNPGFGSVLLLRRPSTEGTELLISIHVLLHQEESANILTPRTQASMTTYILHDAAVILEMVRSLLDICTVLLLRYLH